MPGTAQGQAGTSRDKQGQAGTSRDKQGQTGTFPFVRACPFLSLSVHACPCLSLYVPVCPCLSLYVSIFAIPSCLPLQVNIKVFISMNIVTLTFLAKGTVPMHANLVFNFFFTFHLASLITLSLNPNFGPKPNITEGSTVFLFFIFTFFLFIHYCKLMYHVTFILHFSHRFLKKILDAEQITLWALNFWPSTLARVTSPNSLFLIFIWAW